MFSESSPFFFSVIRMALFLFLEGLKLLLRRAIEPKSWPHRGRRCRHPINKNILPVKKLIEGMHDRNKKSTDCLVSSLVLPSFPRYYRTNGSNILTKNAQCVVEMANYGSRWPIFGSKLPILGAQYLVLYQKKKSSTALKAQSTWPIKVVSNLP